MKTRQRVPAKASSESSFTPIPAKPLQSRPFAAESAVSPTRSTPDIQTQLNQARRFDYDLSNLSVSASSPATVQPKLTIGQPGDRYEQEADRMASQVVNQIHTPAPQQSGQAQTVQREKMPEEEDKVMPKLEGNSIQRETIPEEEDKVMPKLEGNSIQRETIPEEEDKVMPKLEGNSIQREEMPEEEDKVMPKLEGNSIQRETIPEEEEELQRKSTEESHQAGKAATPDLESSIQQLRGNGQPLADNVRAPMEQAFGADFSGVRVHTDAQSNQLNRSIQARAFTTGQDVFFRQGAYNPGSRDGQELIAHELTHVVQQNGSAVQQKQTEL